MKIRKINEIVNPSGARRPSTFPWTLSFGPTTLGLGGLGRGVLGGADFLRTWAFGRLHGYLKGSMWAPNCPGEVPAGRPGSENLQLEGGMGARRAS